VAGEAKVPFKAVYALELCLPDLVGVLWTTPISVELGSVVQHPLDGKLHKSGRLAPPLEHIGHVTVHEDNNNKCRCPNFIKRETGKTGFSLSYPDKLS
jgi:hypothetical protein